MPTPKSKRIDILKALAHPVRIRILEELTEGVKCVTDLEESLGTSQSNMSQHLSLMRRHNLIDYYMDGRLRCYFLLDPLVPDLIDILKKDYVEDIPPPDCCPVTRKGVYPGNRKH